MGDDGVASWPAVVVRTTGWADWVEGHSWTRDERQAVHRSWRGVEQVPGKGHPKKRSAMEPHSCWREQN